MILRFCPVVHSDPHILMPSNECYFNIWKLCYEKINLIVQLPGQIIFCCNIKIRGVKVFCNFPQFFSNLKRHSHKIFDNIFSWFKLIWTQDSKAKTFLCTVEVQDFEVFLGQFLCTEMFTHAAESDTDESDLAVKIYGTTESEIFFVTISNCF